jgi:transmembrane sensor
MPIHSPKTREEASVWLAKLERGLRAEEGLELREWLKDAANSACILEMANIWQGPEAATVLSKIFRGRARFVRPKARRSLRNMAGIAAATLAVVLAGICVLNSRTPWSYFGESHAQSSPGFIKMYATAIGETRDVELLDGSSIVLNSATRVVVMYGPRWRIVSLTIGEATFRAVHDSKRPFTVQAETCLFEAAGTTFDVRILTHENVELAVTEGAVKVIGEGERPTDVPTVQLGGQMVKDDKTIGPLEVAQLDPELQTVRKVDEIELKERLAWQQGMIFFRQAPFADAIAEIQRYTTTRFLIADDRLRNIRIDGHFRIGDVEGVLAALSKDFPVDARRDGRGTIVLTLSYPPTS